MRTMLEPRAHFAQPVAIGSGIQAELLLDGRVDENPRDVVIFCRQLDHAGYVPRPQGRHNALTVARHQIQRLRFQQLGGGPARFRQLQEDIDIQSGLVAGVSTVKATAGRHPHIANQHRAQPQIMYLVSQTLDEQHQIRVAEITPLIGAHHLIGIRLERKLLGTDDTAVGKGANGLRAPRHRVGDFLPWRRGQTGSTGKQRQQSNCGFFHVYQRGMVVVTSAFCARWRRK